MTPDQDEAVTGLIGRLERDLLTRHREIGGVRAGRAASRTVDSLARLCICNTGPDTDGPEQDCPLHGDVTSFVDLCRWRDAVVAAAHAVNDTVADGPGLVVVQRAAWEKLRDLLNAGPWAGPAGSAPRAELVTPVQDPVDAALAAGIEHYNARKGDT